MNLEETDSLTPNAAESSQARDENLDDNVEIVRLINGTVLGLAHKAVREHSDNVQSPTNYKMVFEAGTEVPAEVTQAREKLEEVRSSSSSND
ncbi:hypothetical protein LTR86_011109 [Recurvomyces mirabilis]|nr:hypothetical protein LTR86_011109 [Recurvomyces mirabilis]